MLFLLRFAFWILVICLLLPGQPGDNQHLISSAERTVNDVRGFCVRNPEVCEDARVIMTSMLTKLKNGAELIQTWLAKDPPKGTEASSMFAQQAAPPEGQAQEKEAVQPFQAAPRWEDDLTPSDKEVPWRGPQRL